VKKIIKTSTLKEAQDLTARALACATAKEVEDLVIPEMRRRFPQLIKKSE